MTILSDEAGIPLNFESRTLYLLGQLHQGHKGLEKASVDNNIKMDQLKVELSMRLDVLNGKVATHEKWKNWVMGWAAGITLIVTALAFLLGMFWHK